MKGKIKDYEDKMDAQLKVYLFQTVVKTSIVLFINYFLAALKLDLISLTFYLSFFVIYLQIKLEEKEKILRKEFEDREQSVIVAYIFI